MLIKIVRDFFLAVNGVSAIVGSKIVPAPLPQECLPPAVDIRIPNSSHDHSLNELGPGTHTVKVDCYSDIDAEQADQIADLLMYSGIVGFRGVRSSLFINSVRLVSGPSQSTEGVEPGSDKHRYVTSFSLQIIVSR